MLFFFVSILPPDTGTPGSGISVTMGKVYGLEDNKEVTLIPTIRDYAFTTELQRAL
jgi:hypothetical protein